MTKFISDAQILEVCEYARYCPGYLNRQLITLLMSKCLGVSDSVFRELQVPITAIFCKKDPCEDTNSCRTRMCKYQDTQP